MQDNTSKQNAAVIGIVSEPNFLTVKIIEKFLSLIFRVNVFTNDIKGWEKSLKHITNRKNLNLFDLSLLTTKANIKHIIFVGGFSNDDPYNVFNKHYTGQHFSNKKTILIAPFEKYDIIKNERLPINGNLAVVYTGDVLGEGLEVNTDLKISRLLKEATNENTFTVGIGSVFYPTTVQSLAEQISEWIFSFGPYGKISFVSGTQVSNTEMWRQFSNFFPGLKLFTDETERYLIPKNVQRLTLPGDYKEVLAAIARGGSVQKQKRVVKKRKRIPKIKIPFKLKYALLTFILVFLPYLVCIVSGSLMFGFYKSFQKHNYPLARNLLLIDSTPSLAGRYIAKAYSSIPLVGKLYEPSLVASIFIDRGVDIGVELTYTLQDSEKIIDGFLGKEEININEVSTVLYSHATKLNTHFTSLLRDTENLRSSIVYKKIDSKINMQRTADYLDRFPKIAQSLPQILGGEDKKSYLLLFQNNMELRPTGGFIGSIGIVTFEKGSMIDFLVSDVYSVDGQLKGHIEPPAPIVNYLNEPSWFLRDSNWDPNFSVSAKRAEWFLDKEIDEQVDGVVAVDLDVVKQILKYLGEVDLADYNLKVNEKNFYQITQSEVQNDFFPGSSKKASFLTSLSRIITRQVIDAPQKTKIEIAKSLASLLEGRHIQLYFNDQTLQDIFDKLNFTGKIEKIPCDNGQSCYSDYLMLVEANLGVNKANYFVKREATLNVKIDEQTIHRQLLVNFKNTAPNGLGQDGIYKNYMRVIVPEDAKDIKVRDITSAQETELDYDTTEKDSVKEIGFLVTTLNSSTSQLVITWDSDLKANTNYYLLRINPQAGMEANIYKNVKISSSLTVQPNYIYNMLSGKDIKVPFK